MESQEFGPGRRTWSPWSSVVSCAVVVADGFRAKFGCVKAMGTHDCGKRNGEQGGWEGKRENVIVDGHSTKWPFKACT